MDCIFQMIFLLTVGWVLSPIPLALSTEYDCRGQAAGKCLSPLTCAEDFAALCPSELSRCCPEPVKTLGTAELLRARAPGCNKRKCMIRYNGWWANPCVPIGRTMFYCSAGNVYCCSSSACRITRRCLDDGGYCISNRRKCPGKTYFKLCKGFSCYCCVPPKTTTSTTKITTSVPTTTTTPIKTTTTTSSTSTTPIKTTTSTSTTTTTPIKTTTLTSTTTTTSIETTTPTSTTTTTPIKTPTPTSTTTTTPFEATTTTTSAPTATTTPSPYCLTIPTSPSVCPATGSPGLNCTCPKSCYEYGENYDGIAPICPISNCVSMKVKCVDGWTTLVFRDKTKVMRSDFGRSWQDYKEGFGSAPGEYWLGNEYVHALTSNSPHQMRVYAVHPDGSHRELFYGSFSVGSESTMYRLSVSDFDAASSTGLDMFVTAPDLDWYLDGASFSTIDSDNDNLGGSCSSLQDQVGWWFNSCSGIVPTDPNITWHFWDFSMPQEQHLQRIRIDIKPVP